MRFLARFLFVTIIIVFFFVAFILAIGIVAFAAAAIEIHPLFLLLYIIYPIVIAATPIVEKKMCKLYKYGWMHQGGWK